MNRILILIAIASTLSAQSTPWKISIGALAAGNAADWESSIGMREANPLLRSSDGTFSPGRGALVKCLFVGAMALGEHYAIDRYGRDSMHTRRRLYRVFTVANVAAAGLFTAMAARNWSIR
jgi:hypothetical protein